MPREPQRSGEPPDGLSRVEQPSHPKHGLRAASAQATLRRPSATVTIARARAWRPCRLAAQSSARTSTTSESSRRAVRNSGRYGKQQPGSWCHAGSSGAVHETWANSWEYRSQLIAATSLATAVTPRAGPCSPTKARERRCAFQWRASDMILRVPLHVSRHSTERSGGHQPLRRNHHPAYSCGCSAVANRRV